LEPSIDSGDDFIWIGFPVEGFGVLIMFLDEAIDRILQVNEGVEHAVFEPSARQFGEEALNGIQP